MNENEWLETMHGNLFYCALQPYFELLDNVYEIRGIKVTNVRGLHNTS